MLGLRAADDLHAMQLVMNPQDMASKEQTSGSGFDLLSTRS